MNWEQAWNKYTSMCNRDSQWEPAVTAQGAPIGALWWPRGVGWDEACRRPKREGYMYTYSWSGIKIIPKKKKCKKAKWLSEEALQIDVKRGEVKSKGEKERYTHLNAEFQRIARRNKKAFLSNQCKEIDEINRRGKTRDLFKKIKRYQGTISCKDGLNKGQKW